MSFQRLVILSYCVAGVCGWCWKGAVSRVDGRFYRNEVLFGRTPSPVHVADCQRICRLDLRCFAYQLQWTNSSYGYCEAIGKVKADQNPIEISSSYTLFVFCPHTMTFFPSTGACYVFVRGELFGWDAGLAYCQRLHRDAHLMDIQSEEEQLMVRKLTGGSSVSSIWLGGRRFTPGVYDLVWVNTKTNIYSSNYTNWQDGEPTDPRDDSAPQDCVRIRYASTWTDDRCTHQYNILCEF